MIYILFSRICRTRKRRGCPTGTSRRNDVELTSMRRYSHQRQYDVILTTFHICFVDGTFLQNQQVSGKGLKPIHTLPCNFRNIHVYTF